MKNIILTIIAALAVNFSALAANIGTESGTSYNTSTWVNGASSSVGTWELSGNSGSRGTPAINYAPSFSIADSSQGGRASIGTSAFTLGIPDSYNAFSRAMFTFGGGSLLSGQSVSFDLNFLWSGGKRGFAFQNSAGGALFGAYHEWSDPLIAYSGGLPSNTTVLANAYQKAVTVSASLSGSTVNWSIFEKGGSTALVSSSSSLGDGEDVGKIYFYAGDNQDMGANVNNFSMSINNINVVPEPSSSLLMGIGLAGLVVLRRFRKTA
jgi:hypothetical protein